jgi:putative flippase GtrA
MNGMRTYVKLVLIGLLTIAVVMFVFWLLSDKVP